MKKLISILLFSLLLTTTTSFGFVSTQDFRDIYLDQLSQSNANYSSKALNQIIIPLRTDFLNSNFTSIEELDEFFIDQDLNTLIDQTVANQPKQLLNLSINNIKETITLVLIPGLLSEFTPNESYEDIFEKYNQNSSFRKEWGEASGSSFRIPFLYDPRPKDDVLNLDKVSYVIGERARNVLFKRKSKLLSELIDVSSIDDSNGKTLVEFIRLKTSFLSLETLGSIKDTAKNYNRRLDKFFKAMDRTSENIYLLGYSRGTPISLEMLAQAKKSGNPWLRNVKGMISVGGVALGTHDADAAFNDREDDQDELDSRKQMRGLKTRLLGTDLKNYPGLRTLPHFHEDTIGFEKGRDNFRENWEIILSNLEQYRLLLQDLVPEIPAEFKKTWIWKIPKGTPSNQILSTVRKKIWPLSKKALVEIKKLMKNSTKDPNAPKKDADLFGMGSMVYKAIFKSYDFFNALTGVDCYNRNILRTREIIKSLLTSVKELTTKSRKDWWKNTDLPKDIRFYSIAATGDGGSGIFNDNITFNSQAESCAKQLGNHKNFFTNFTYKLNDGAVPAHRTMFFPSIIENLNPGLNINFTFLGLVGTTHWGLALPYVHGKAGNKESWNPYPREALIKALAIALDYDLHQ